MSFSDSDSAVDSRGAGGARTPLELGVERIEREKDNLLLQVPLDLKSYLRR